MHNLHMQLYNCRRMGLKNHKKNTHVNEIGRERSGARPFFGSMTSQHSAFHRVFINSRSSRICQMSFRRGVSLMAERISGDFNTESRAQHLSMASTDSAESSHWSSASAATSAFPPSEHLSSVEWSSGCGSDGPSGQSRCLSPSDSLQQVHWFLLPGQVPYWPAVPWDVPSPASGPRASPVSSSTGKPRERRWTKGLRTFARKMWKAVKRPFCCGHRSSVDVVEPFVPPADLDSEPEPSASPGPDQSGVRTSEESFESLFDVEKMIGEGGFGRVYEGTRKFDGKRVAIKRIRKIHNNCYLSIPGHPRPLITEVALMLMMRREPRSPFAVQLYDWFEHPRKFTLVMEYPEPCESLLDFMIANPELDEATTRAILSQAVLAVQHCVDHGVFHSDVHPQNFLLREDTMELKLIDFGCGQMLSGDGYDSDTYSGVWEYCPPEVITEPRFHAIPANVWALGTMLYAMMSGYFPTLTTTDATRAQVIFRNPDLSEECMDLTSQCLSLDPAQRPTLEQMLEHDWFRGDPVDWSSSGESSSCDFRK